MLGRTRQLALPLFLLVWIAPPFWSMVTMRGVNIQDDVYASDMINNMLPCRAAVGQALRQGEYPSWTSGIYTGFPLLAQTETGALYPTNLLLFSLLPPYVAIMIAQIMALVIAGASLYLLARQYRLPVSASLFGAGAFCLSGFFVSHLRHLSMIDAACWIPLQLLLVERLVGRSSPRAAIWLALVWVVQLLAGHPQISYYAGLVMIVVLVVRWRQIDRRTNHAPGLWPCRFIRDSISSRFVVAVVLGSTIAGAQLIPSVELTQLGHRAGGLTFEEASIYPAAPRNVLTFVSPGINGDPADGTYKLSNAFWEEYGYLGVLPLLSALAAMVLCWRRRPIVKLFACLTVISYLLVLGKNTPLLRVVYWVIPGMDYFRFPTRFLVFVELSLAVLAAFGLADIMRRVGSRPIRAALLVVVFCATAADLWYHQSRQVAVAEMKQWVAPIATERYLAGQRETAAPWRYYSLEAMRVHALTYKTNKGWRPNLQPYVDLREIMQPSFNLLFQLEAVDGYVNLVPGHVEAVWGSELVPGWVHPPGRVVNGVLVLRRELIQALRAFNVRYIVSPYQLDQQDFTKVFSNGRGVAVYQVHSSLPRAFVVGEVVRAADASAARKIFASPGFDPARQAVVHEEVTLPHGAESSQRTSIDRSGESQVRVRVQLDKPGLLVLSETYYPGWRAELDGVDVPIVRANVMMRAVVIPAGRHEVVFTYASSMVRFGLALSLLGLVALAVLGRAWLKITPTSGSRAGPPQLDRQAD